MIPIVAPKTAAGLAATWSTLVVWVRSQADSAQTATPGIGIDDVIVTTSAAGALVVVGYLCLAGYRAVRHTEFEWQAMSRERDHEQELRRGVEEDLEEIRSELLSARYDILELRGLLIANGIEPPESEDAEP